LQTLVHWFKKCFIRVFLGLVCETSSGRRGEKGSNIAQALRKVLLLLGRSMISQSRNILSKRDGMSKRGRKRVKNRG